MDFLDLLKKAGYDDAAARTLSTELQKLGVSSVAALEKLPAFVGFRLAGFPTYKVVADIVQQHGYLEIKNAPEPRKKASPKKQESEETPIERFYKRLKLSKISPKLITGLQDMGFIPGLSEQIPDEAFQKLGASSDAIKKIRDISDEFLV